MKNRKAIVLCAIGLSGVLGFIAKAEAERPNIIFVLTDDQGYGDLSAHGHPLLNTPHMDRTHAESVRFDNFYVSPSCSPTRAALLTGRHEFRSGVTHTIPPREHLHLSATTLPQLLSESGYATGFIGKWHLCGKKSYAPLSRGFTWSATNPGGPRNHFNVDMIRNNKKFPTKGYREDRFFDEAMTFMDESVAAEKPFFCYLSTYSPHDPLAAPEEFITPFKGKCSDEQAIYLAMIANLDYNMGRLYEYMEKKGLDENTILIFMNDNGVTKGLDVYNANMRGSKCSAWEGGCRAFSFWRWPNKWKPYTANNLTAHLDVLPTLCNLAKVEVKPELKTKLEGFDLKPLLEAGKEHDWGNDDRVLYHHVARWPGGLAAQHKYSNCGVRQGEYLLLRSLPCTDDTECKKYMSQCTTLRLVEKGMRTHTYTKDNAQYHWGFSAPNQWSLFNVKNDPGNFNDISAQQPELVAKLTAAYDAWWDDMCPEMIANGGDDGEGIPYGKYAQKLAAEKAAKEKTEAGK